MMKNEIISQGMLYLCATPIGNLKDMTPRVIEVLNEVDIIAAEDTRNSIHLLTHFDIKTPMTSYHEYNKIDKARVLIDMMKQGKNVALITDAGTPAISDPGEVLVKMCHEEDITVTSLPGACACITALTMSGLSTRRFCFEAFLPSDKTDRKERNRILDTLVNETRTIIIYEAPHRLVATLKQLRECLGNRNITLCRELTKKFETVIPTTFDDALEIYQSEDPRGEYVIVIEGKSFEALEKEKQESYESMTLQEHMKMYEDKGLERNEAMRAVAKDRGISKRDVYAALFKN